MQGAAFSAGSVPEGMEALQCHAGALPFFLHFTQKKGGPSKACSSYARRCILKVQFVYENVNPETDGICKKRFGKASRPEGAEKGLFPVHFLGTRL